MSISCTLAVQNPGDDPLQWLRDSIPGEPGTDYPIFSSVEQTSFSCEDKVFGGKYCTNQLQNNEIWFLKKIKNMTYVIDVKIMNIWF